MKDILEFLRGSSFTGFETLIMVVLAEIVLGVLKKIPDMVSNLITEKYKFNTTRNLQIEAYYREVSGKDVEALFRDWFELLRDWFELGSYSSDRFKNKQIRILELNQRTIMYGSERTTKICALFMNHIHNSENGTLTVKYHTVKYLAVKYKDILYMLSIVASLKEDYTGQKIDIDTMSKILFNDYQKHKDIEEFKNAKKEVENEVKNLN